MEILKENCSQNDEVGVFCTCMELEDLKSIHKINELVVNDVGDTVLHEASCKGLVETLRALLSFNINVNVRNDMGTTPLMYACRERRPLIVSALLRKNADVDAISECGETALSFATKRGCDLCVRRLLDSTCSVSLTKVPLPKRPLIIAAQNNRALILSDLLADCDLEHCRQEITLAFHFARKYNFHVIQEILRGTNYVEDCV